MSMDWFRWHHGTVTDPKWRVIARKSGASVRDVLAVFAFFLERASQAEPRGSIAGWDADDIAAGLDMDAEEVTAIYDAMQGKVLDGDTLSGWSKRQPKRERDTADSSTDRVRKHRESQKTAISEDGVTADETPRNANDDDEAPCNATKRHETPRLDKIREDKKDSVANATGAAAPQSDADWLWAEGVSYLCSHNVPERQARSQIGKWRKHGDGIARAAVQAAMAQGTRDPIPFIEKAVSSRGAGSLSEDAAHAAFIEEQRRLWAGTGLPL